MVRKSGLGKGLDALIPGGEFQSHSSQETNPQPGGIIQLPIDQIKPNPHQPRIQFNPQELAELAESIREHGIIQPLLVTQGETGEIFILIAGERRLIAAQQAGLTSIPAIVREVSDQERVELALIENIQRADLGPLETAEAYRQLNEEYGLPHDQIAARVGKSRTSVTNTLRLLKLPQEIQKALMDGIISEGHARALLSLPTSQAQLAALQTITKNTLNVRQTEDLVRRLTGQKPKSSPTRKPSPEIQSLESRLRESLGTKVNLNQKRKGGTLVIHYYSQEELDQLVERILDD
jgi:ParB family chromosome partitioning protein